MLTLTLRRMFREPEPEHKTHTIKLDTTGNARTPIRRRHHRNRFYRPSLERQIERERQYHEGIIARADRDALFDILMEDQERADHTLRWETRNTRAGQGASRDRGARDRDSEDMNRRRLERGRALLTESLRYERPGHRMRLPQESALRYEMSATTSPPSELRDRVQTDPDWIPLPRSFPELEGRRSLSPGDELQLSRSQRFAPAYRLTDETSRSPHHVDTQRTSITPVPRDERDRPASYASRDSPIPEMVVNHADGLGDRRRSFSPEESTWTTLFTTITPDERLPSAESSFTSASASAASSLSSHSASTSSTLLTAPSTNAATINAFSHICDDASDASGSDMEDDFPLGDYTDAFTGDVRGAAVDGDEDTDRAEQSGRRAQDPEERLSSRRWRLDRNAELQHLHAIHDRLERQLPVPDDWWASAGLSRNLGVRADRVERGRL